jgi:putative endonuclease
MQRNRSAVQLRITALLRRIALSRERRPTSRLLSARPGLARLTVRFDVVLVTPGRLPLHLPNAWQA